MKRRRSDPKTRALEVCLQGIQAGINLERVLSTYPQFADQLRPLLWTAILARNHCAELPIPELAQEHSRAGFLQISQRMLPRSERPWVTVLLRLLLGILILLALVGAAALALDRVSAQSMPGEWLYPLKLNIERLQVSWQQSPPQHLAMEIANDQKRLAEVQQLLQDPKRLPISDIEFSGMLEQMQGAEWQISGIPIDIPANAQIVGDLQTGYAVTVQGKLQANGSLLAKRIQVREFTLVGVISNISEERLGISGQEVLLSAETIVLGAPIPGSQARVILRLTSFGNLYARLIEVLD